ncbi:MAG: hypothetical protein IJ708_15845 [Clostridia bacterium]|nr:hypothetical protein [Clostridia bacterium]
MTKLISILLMLCLTVSCALAGAESEFSQNLEAFIESVDLETKDLLVDLDFPGDYSDYLLQVGKNENGIVAKVYDVGLESDSFALQVDAETAYVSVVPAEITVALKYETLVSYAQSFIKNTLGIPVDLISPEQLMADASVIVSKLAPLAGSAVTMVDVSEIEGGYRVTLNSQVAAQVITGGIDALLGDDEVKGIIDRYASLLATVGVELSSNVLSQAWDGTRDNIAAAISALEASADVMDDGTYQAKATLTKGEDVLNVTSTGSVDLETGAIDTLTEVSKNDEAPVATVKYTAGADGVLYEAKGEGFSLYEKLELAGEELVKFDYVLTEEDTPVIEMHYADGNCTITAPDLNIAVEKTFEDANSLELLLTMKAAGQETIAKLTYTVNENELTYKAETAGQEYIVKVTTTDKGTYANLSEAENLVVVTEELLDSLVSELLEAGSLE